MTDTPVKVAVLGAGRISQFHADAFRRADAKIVGFADVRRAAAEDIAARFGARAAGTEDELLALRPDVIVIATPHDLHVPQAEAALRGGVDVFLDKPLALSSRSGEQLVALAAALGRNLGVNHNLLFHPAVVAARQYVPRLGRVVSASGWSEGWLDIKPWDFRLSRERTGGGAWFDAGPHLLYTLADLVGPFAELAGLRGTGPSRLGGEDTVAVAARFANGAVATLRISYAHTAPGSRLTWPEGWSQGVEINGSDGAMRITVTPVGELEVMAESGADWQVLATGLSFAASFDGAAADFLAQRTTAGGQGSARQSIQVLEWIEQAFQASTVSTSP